MKGKLEFNLPEENKEFTRCSKVDDIVGCLQELETKITSIRDAEDNMPTDELSVAFYATLHSWGVDLTTI